MSLRISLQRGLYPVEIKQLYWKISAIIPTLDGEKVEHLGVPISFLRWNGVFSVRVRAASRHEIPSPQLPPLRPRLRLRLRSASEIPFYCLLDSLLVVAREPPRPKTLKMFPYAYLLVRPPLCFHNDNNVCCCRCV